MSKSPRWCNYESIFCGLVQLDRDDVESQYLNGATFGKNTTDHYVNLKFSRPGIKGAAK